VKQYYIDTKIKMIVFIDSFQEVAMLFQISGITVDPWIPPLVAFAISFFTSMGGISGAFLLLPFLSSFFLFRSPILSFLLSLFPFPFLLYLPLLFLLFPILCSLIPLLLPFPYFQ